MTDPGVHQLDDEVLRRHYDPGSLSRGRGYADERRVNLLGGGRHVIKGVCRGSNQKSYVMSVRWSLDVDDRVTLTDTCTCPLGGACKHCVAAILTARREANRAPLAVVDESWRPDWRRILADLPNEEARQPEPTGLAVQFVVERPAATRWAKAAGPSLTVRPLRRGKTGKWIKSGISWGEIGATYGALADVDPTQRAALRSVATSARLDFYYGSSQAVPLGQFGPDLWYLLGRALDAGVELVDEHLLPRVDLSPVAARPSIDLTADRNGAIMLETGFTLEEEPLPIGAGRGGTVGSPVHGLWLREGSRIRLVPLAEPLHPAVARLAGDGRLTVPSDDVDEFLDEFQPLLARHAAVASSDGSVTLTTTRFEGLVLVVERTALDTATVQWKARYRRGERVTDHLLQDRFGRSREWDAEADAEEAVELPTDLAPLVVDHHGELSTTEVAGADLVSLLTVLVPWLDERGQVQVEVILGDQPALRHADEDPLIALTVTDGEDGADRQGGNDWFDLDVEIRVDGELVDFISLFAALSRGEEVFILPSGTWLDLERPELAKLRELIEEARGLAEPVGDGVARLNPFQVGWFEELAALGVVAEQSSRWAKRVGNMAALTAPEPVDVPEELKATLRPYQQEGLDWLAFLHRHGLGGILADDMGLGKTVQTLALCLHVLRSKPDARFLVVAPTSVVENWAHEAARFAPTMPVATIRETAVRRSTSLEDAIDGASLVVTSYALFRLEFEHYAEQGWELLLLDEAQFVKNHQSKTYQCARRLEAATKIAITGTPLENSLMDLWSLLSIAAPGLYPDPKRFSETYRKPIESGRSPELLATLRRRIAPLMRRRTKDAVLTELPPKIEQTVEVDLSPKHARIYATQLQRERQKVLGLVTDVQKHRFEIFRSLTLLRQLALDPALVDDEHEGVGSAKLDRLLDDLTQIVAEGHRALVFSQFTRYLARVRTRLDAAGIDHAYLDGRTRKRAEVIDRFKTGDAPVFVISLKAGGVGLNLTEADYCFVLDPWWNPATETQAVDRAHRIGQPNPVVVYRYVSTDTIEEKVMQLKARKADLFNSVVDAEGALAGAITEDDIRGLLDLG